MHIYLSPLIYSPTYNICACMNVCVNINAFIHSYIYTQTRHFPAMQRLHNKFLREPLFKSTSENTKDKSTHSTKDEGSNVAPQRLSFIPHDTLSMTSLTNPYISHAYKVLFQGHYSPFFKLPRSNPDVSLRVSVVFVVVLH